MWKNVGGACTLYNMDALRGRERRETCGDCQRGQTNSFRLGEVAIRCVGGVLGGGEDVQATRFDWTYISGGVECSASISVCRGAECVRFPRCRGSCVQHFRRENRGTC